jgi:hypothetical protein
MTTMLSFSLMEKKFLHEFRNRLNLSEDVNDVLNSFSNILSKLLNAVFDHRLSVGPSDIIFVSDGTPKFRFSQNILANNEFKAALKKSDIKNIINRFSYAAEHRCVHLRKHMEKTNSKINAPLKKH